MLVRTFSLFVLLSFGCMDALVGPDYLGDPVFEVEGVVVVTSTPQENLELALVWEGAGQDLEVKNAYTTTTFPASFTMGLYQIPDEDSMRNVPEHPTAKFAVGRLYVFKDLNKDGRLSKREPIIGKAQSKVVTYFSSSGKSPIVRDPFQEGFSLMDISCAEINNFWLRGSNNPLVQIYVGVNSIPFSTDENDCAAVNQEECRETIDELGGAANPMEYQAARQRYDALFCSNFYGDLPFL